MPSRLCLFALTLLRAAAADDICASVSSLVSDAWCELNCNANPPFCPASDCTCTAAPEEHPPHPPTNLTALFAEGAITAQAGSFSIPLGTGFCQTPEATSRCPSYDKGVQVIDGQDYVFFHPSFGPEATGGLNYAVRAHTLCPHLSRSRDSRPRGRRTSTSTALASRATRTLEALRC
jgi:hypothetical protein